MIAEVAAVVFIAGIFVAGMFVQAGDYDAEAVIGGIGNLATVGSTHKHNLSASGPGPIKATSEDEICIFCHTPHYAITNAVLIDGPLWNHQLSNATYTWTNLPSTLVNSTTMPNASRIVDGASRMCMSCHDGTVAVGMLAYREVEMTGDSCLVGGKLSSAAGCAGLGSGSGLVTKHIFSIPMNEAMITNSASLCGVKSTKLKYPWDGTANDEVLLRPTNQQYNSTPGISGDDAASGSGLSTKYKTGYYYGVQCSTCHDPHLYVTSGGNSCKFLVSGACPAGNDTASLPVYDALCEACHVDCP